MAKKTTYVSSEQVQLSESTKKLYKALEEHNIPNDSTVAIEFHEGDTEYKVSQNYFTTPIRFQSNELDLDDLHRDGIKIWKTWTFRG